MNEQDLNEARVIELATAGGALDNMTPDLVPLGLIDSNPWQGRLSEDPVHVRALAEDIAVNGLLQPGLGRRVGERVQIAFAHSRLAAFKFLDEAFGASGGNGQAGERFARFPVIVRTLTDRQMSDYAAAENARRKDLTAIETATAIQKRMADFGLTEAEAGAPFGYTNQTTVSHLLSLLRLPALARDLVNQRLLPERLARRLVAFAPIVPDAVVEIANKIAGAPDSERDDVFQEAVQELLDEHGEIMRDLWPLEWGAGEAMLDGERQVIARCRGCDFRIMTMGNYHCARPTCYAVKKTLWTEHELSRLSERLGLPIAGMGDTTIEPIIINWDNNERAKAYLKRRTKPDLYLMPEDGQLLPNSGSVKSYHQRLLDCKVVLLGSTNPHLFDQAGDKPAAGTSVDAKVSSAVEETPAACAKRVEREEAEAEERREARSALHRGRHDLVWLVFHTAEALAPAMQISGGILPYCAHLTYRYTSNPAYEWPEYRTIYDPLDRKLTWLGNGRKKADTLDEGDLRRYLLVRRFASEIGAYKAEEQFNWGRGIEAVEAVAEELGLALPSGWDKPPIHTTPVNCHVCGQFTPGSMITGKDIERGWKAEGDVVTCSDGCREMLDGQRFATFIAAESAPKASKAKAKSKAKPVKKATLKRGKK